MDDVVHDDRLKDMTCNAGAESFTEVYEYESMSSDTETPLLDHLTSHSCQRC